MDYINLNGENEKSEDARQELYKLIEEGLDSIKAGKTTPVNEVIKKIKLRRNERNNINIL